MSAFCVLHVLEMNSYFIKIVNTVSLKLHFLFNDSVVIILSEISSFRRPSPVRSVVIVPVISKNVFHCFVQNWLRCKGLW